MNVRIVVNSEPTKSFHKHGVSLETEVSVNSLSELHVKVAELQDIAISQAQAGLDKQLERVKT